MAKKPYFGDKKSNILETHFFLRNRASSLFYIYQSLTSCKKSGKSNDGKYENFWDRQTDRRTDGQTDGGGFIRTPEGVLKILAGAPATPGHQLLIRSSNNPLPEKIFGKFL